MTNKQEPGLFRIVHSEEEKKKALERMLEEINNPEKKEKVNGKIEGLLIGNSHSIELYDFNAEKIETAATDLKGVVYSLAFHNNDAWVGQGHSWNGITSLKNKKEFCRDNRVLSLFSYKNLLFDAGEYGIWETSSNTGQVQKKDLENRGISCIDCLFCHDEKVMVLATLKDGYHAFYEILEKAGKLSLGNKQGTNGHNHQKICQATSVHGKILTTLPLTKLDIDGVPAEETMVHHNYNMYASIAFDPFRDILYAGGHKINSVNQFKVRNEHNKPLLEADGYRVLGLSDEVYALLPATQKQMEIIRGK